MEDINIVIAGSAGEGIQTIGALLAKALSTRGYAVFSWQEYESRIRGGQNSYSIRIGDAPHNAALIPADILVALNNGAALKYRPLLHRDGILLGSTDDNGRSIAIPFTEIAKDHGGAIYSNAVAIGAVGAVLGLPMEVLTLILSEAFSSKGETVVSQNQSAAEKGFEAAQRACNGMCLWQFPKRKERYFFIDGNDALALGAARGGCNFISAYPMTPATGIITYFANHQKELEAFVEQAEDEISAINMALGASYAGARAMTATSGGGFALMVEGISLAGMTETPVVIVLAQRPGPATGLPTRTAQGDLLFAVHAGHGEFAKMVLAPSDPKDAFAKCVKAFNMADKYQIPVIVMTDQFLVTSTFSIDSFDIEKYKASISHPDRSEFQTNSGRYQRYTLTDDGISPRRYPGESQHLVCADSDEHDVFGHITEDLSEVALPMIEKRLRKFESLRSEVARPEEIFVQDADTVLVGWGSSRQALFEAVTEMRGHGQRMGMIHLTELWPLPDYTFPSGKRYWSVENNATAQLARLLRSEYDIAFQGAIARYDGLPLTSDYICRGLDKEV